MATSLPLGYARNMGQFDEFLAGFQALRQEAAQANATAAELAATGRVLANTVQAQAPTVADAASRVGYGVQQGGAGINRLGQSAPGFSQGLRDAAAAGRQGASAASSAVRLLKGVALFSAATLVLGAVGYAVLDYTEGR